MGGGHHISRNDYDLERLIRVLRTFKTRWGKDHVYLEPGEAVGLNTGYLIAEVQDIIGARKTSVAKTNPPNTLSHDQDRPSAQSHRPQQDALGAAVRLHRSLQDAESRLAGADAAQRLHAETESLLEWARLNDCLLSAAELPEHVRVVTELGGASEHDVWLSADQSRVLKWTKPPNFGARGSAKSYLENVIACNALFGLDWRFEAVVKAADGVRILTSQPFVIGENPTVTEIDSWFAALGFTKERENTYAREDGLKIADARPDNILRRSDGTFVPIDVHVLGISLDSLPDDEEAAETACDVLPTAILDISASAHMPDTLEMPYRPHIMGGGLPGEFPHEYKVGGMTCLAGDVLSGFSFPEPLQIGQRLVFADMAHYTMVKTTTFNGVHHPDIVIYDPETKQTRVVKKFGYEHFRDRLS
jgi:hypothetical protein